MIRNIRSFFSRSRRRARRPSPPALCRGRRGAALLLGLLLLTGCAGGETDTAAKNQTGLQPGDTLSFLCDYYRYDGTYEDSYVLGDPVTVTEEPLAVATLPEIER